MNREHLFKLYVNQNEKGYIANNNDLNNIFYLSTLGNLDWIDFLVFSLLTMTIVK